MVMTGQRRRRRYAEGGGRLIPLYGVRGEQRTLSGRRSVRMGNGSEMWARAGGGRRECESVEAWKRGSVGGLAGRRSAVGLDGEERRRGEGSEGSEGRPWGSEGARERPTRYVLLATRYSLLAACCLAWAWFTGLLWLCQDSRSVPIASRPASIQLRGPSKSRDGSGCGGKGPR
jgi:hypothetical protein